jgi:hypothetical protein
MIREIVKPENTNLTINIPEDYVGQEIEYIVFPISKSSTKKVINNNDIESLGGILNKYANPSKIELEDKAWELHVMDKFSK